jgi:hypothetical protein
MSIIGAATPDHTPAWRLCSEDGTLRLRLRSHRMCSTWAYGVAEASNGSAAFSDKRQDPRGTEAEPDEQHRGCPRRQSGGQTEQTQGAPFHGRLSDELWGCHDRVAHRTRVGSASARELADILISRNTEPVARLP